jgi:hypothetical protein
MGSAQVDQVAWDWDTRFGGQRVGSDVVKSRIPTQPVWETGADTRRFRAGISLDSRGPNKEWQPGKAVGGISERRDRKQRSSPPYEQSGASC